MAQSVFVQVAVYLCCPAATLPSFPRAPVAVAVATMSTAEMLAAGMKGKGFAVLHTYMDHLWWVYCQAFGKICNKSRVFTKISICASVSFIC